MRRLFPILLLILVVGLIPRPVFACSYDEDAVPTIAEQIASADVVFTGTIISTETEGDSEYPYTGVVLVHAYYKTTGAIPFRVTVTGFGAGEDCTPYGDLGEEYLFYATGDPSGTLKVTTLFDTQYHPRAETLDEIQRIMGTAPVAPDKMSIVQLLAPELLQNPVWIVLILLVPLILLILLFVVTRRRTMKQ